MLLLESIGAGLCIYGIERITRNWKREQLIKQHICEIWDTICLVLKFAGYTNNGKFYNLLEIKKMIKKPYGYDLIFNLPIGSTFIDIYCHKYTFEASFRKKIFIDYDFPTGKITLGLYLNDYNIEFEPIKTEPYELFVGYINEKPRIIDMNRRPHLFITGTTGTGKNVLAQMIVANQIHFHDSTKVQFYFTQLMKQELIEFKYFENTKGIAFTLEDAVKMFKELDDIMEKRTKEIFRYVEQGIKNIKQYNERFKSKQMPYIFLVIDEYAFYMPEKSDNKDVKIKKAYCISIIKKILFDGRALGIFCIPIAQRPDSETITGSFKAQVTNIITFQQSNEISSQVAIDDKIAAYLGEREAIVKTNGLEFLRIPFVTDGLIKKYTAHRRKNDKKANTKVIDMTKMDKNIKEKIEIKNKTDDGIIRKGVVKHDNKK